MSIIDVWHNIIYAIIILTKGIHLFDRYHYNKHIMRQVFSEWYDMWWHVRKEWRLMVRAECHFRQVQSSECKHSLIIDLKYPLRILSVKDPFGNKLKGFRVLSLVGNYQHLIKLCKISINNKKIKFYFQMNQKFLMTCVDC